MLTENEIHEPLKMLAEIEAYLTFRLLTDTPTVPADDMQQIKNDVAECLRRNGSDVGECEECFVLEVRRK